MRKTIGLILAAVMLTSALPAAILSAEADTDTTQTVTAEASEEKGTIVNCRTQVNVREKATSKSKLLGTAKKGETFTVRGRSGNWIKIDFNGKEGYICKTYLKID